MVANIRPMIGDSGGQVVIRAPGDITFGPTAYQSKFHITGHVWLPDGVAEVSSILLDTGAQLNIIGPSTVMYLGLRARGIPPVTGRGVNNLPTIYDKTVAFQLTIAGVSRTVHALVDHNDSSYSLLLAMPGLYAFGIDVHCRTNPVTATMHPFYHTYGEAGPVLNLVADFQGTRPMTTFISKLHVPYYFSALMDHGSFPGEGELPLAAYSPPMELSRVDWDKVTSSIKSKEHEAALRQVWDICKPYMNASLDPDLGQAAKMIRSAAVLSALPPFGAF